jgi:hypothetical protein
MRLVPEATGARTTSLPSRGDHTRLLSLLRSHARRARLHPCSRSARRSSPYLHAPDRHRLYRQHVASLKFCFRRSGLCAEDIARPLATKNYERVCARARGWISRCSQIERAALESTSIEPSTQARGQRERASTRMSSVLFGVCHAGPSRGVSRRSSGRGCRWLAPRARRRDPDRSDCLVAHPGPAIVRAGGARSRRAPCAPARPATGSLSVGGSLRPSVRALRHALSRGGAQ